MKGDEARGHRQSVLFQPRSLAASTKDPAYAAIEAHKRACEESHQAYVAMDEAERAARKRHGRRADELIIWRNCHIFEAGDRFAETKPTTTAGAAALVAYICADMADGETDWHAPALKTAAEASVALPHV